MARNITFNGVVYTIPDVGDDSWGDNLTNYFVAIPQGALQKSGGTFTLSADVDFGVNYGLLAQYIKSRTILPASTGIIRLSLTDTIAWRNNANSADLALAINGSDQLTFNGNAIYPGGITALTGDVTATGPGSVAASIGAGKVTNTMLAGSIAYSKLVLASSILNSDLAAAVSIAKGGTGQTTQTLGFNALAPTTTKGDLIVFDGSNNVRQGIGTDGQVLVGDSTQTNGLKWTTLQQGAKNYITFNNFENNSTTGWSLGTVTLTNGLPTGVPTFGSGASGNLSIATVSSGQLAGAYSLSYVSSAATTAGNLLSSQAYTIDKEDQAKVIAFKLYYSATVNPANANWSGTSSNSFGVAFWDVANSTFIIPSGCFNFVQSNGVGICQGSFQTPSNMTQFRICLYNANATSGAITMLLDDFYVGPQALAFGPAMSDWTSYTPTISNLGAGSTSALTGYYRRVGDSIEMRVAFVKDATPGSGSSQVSISLPPGLSIDSTKVDLNNAVRSTMGSAEFSTTTYTALGPVVYISPTTTAISIGKAGTAAAYLGSDFVASAALNVNALIPITGFSSNTVMSADSDTRVIAARATTSSQTGTAINVSFSSVTYDKSGSYSGGTFTAPVTGLYSVKCAALVNAVTLSTTQFLQIVINKNGSGQSYNIVFGNGGSNKYLAIHSDEVSLNAQDTVSVTVNCSVSVTLDGTANNFVAIERLSGPAVVAASESVNARYTNSAGTAITTTPTALSFPTLTYDSHSAWSGTTFTAPTTGRYSVKVRVTSTSGAWGAANYLEADIYKNGGLYSELAVDFTDAAVTRALSAGGSDEVPLNGGETMQIKVYVGSGSTNLVSSPVGNYIAIHKI